MMKKQFFFLVFASIFLSSCGGSSSSESITDLSRMDRVEIKEQKQISVDSVIEKIDYVKLGDTGDVLIGKVTHLLVTPDHIVVGDAYNAKAVFIFDRDGNPQAVINRLGRGPQEYQNIKDVFLTPDQRTIGIVDNSVQKLLYFDMQGNFVRKQDLPFNCNKIEYLDDKTLMLASDGWADRSSTLESYPGKNNLLFFTDTTLHIQNSAIVNPFNVEVFYFQPLDAKRFDDRIYAGKAFCDTIYQVTANGIFPRYWLDMTDIDGVANFGKEMSNARFEEMSDFSYFPNMYVESDDYALFFLSNKRNVYPVLFNKNTKTTHNIKFASSTALGLHLLESKFSHRNQFVSVVPAFQFLTFCPDVPGVELRNEIKEGLTDEDNPVLLFYTLKAPNDSPAN